MSWSSGKDSALALEVARRELAFDVVGLLCTVNSDAERVAMHAVRRELLEAQADRLGIVLHVVDIPFPCPNDVYETRMASAMERAVGDGVGHVVFGDLFLEDVRAYREQALEGSGITAVFPLWGRPTDALAREMIDIGIRAVVTCVDPRQAPAGMAGRSFDASFLAELPPGADPCGERGEFHTFVWDAPGFRAPIAVETGEVVERHGFVFCDVLPAPG
ncbi:MAG: adenine nucleotide alpha hydrolase [Acidobacteriota bacterium]|nr:adenine nucleotide alpha hydrolase [Acidobacteriota bacterium]